MKEKSKGPDTNDEAASPARPNSPKPRRFTLEELLEGMTPGEKRELQDDWPVGEELI